MRFRINYCNKYRFSKKYQKGFLGAKNNFNRITGILPLHTDKFSPYKDSNIFKCHCCKLLFEIPHFLFSSEIIIIGFIGINRQKDESFRGMISKNSLISLSVFKQNLYKKLSGKVYYSSIQRNQVAMSATGKMFNCPTIGKSCPFCLGTRTGKRQRHSTIFLS